MARAARAIQISAANQKVDAIVLNADPAQVTAMVGRTLFVGDVIYSIGVSGFIYPIFGHWCWGPDGQDTEVA